MCVDVPKRIAASQRVQTEEVRDDEHWVDEAGMLPSNVQTHKRTRRQAPNRAEAPLRGQSIKYM